MAQLRLVIVVERGTKFDVATYQSCRHRRCHHRRLRRHLHHAQCSCIIGNMLLLFRNWAHRRNEKEIDEELLHFSLFVFVVSFLSRICFTVHD